MLIIIVLTGCAQQKQKVYQVGILSGAEPFANIADGFKSKMTELGYIEGKNIVYDLEKTNFEPTKEEQILKKFATDKVDLIFVFPTEPAVSAKKITQGTDIPVVFAMSGIEGTNLVNS